MKTQGVRWCVAFGVCLTGVCLAAGAQADGPSATATNRLAAAPAILRTFASQLGGLEREWQTVLGGKAGEARIPTGEEGQNRLKAIMKDSSDKGTTFTLPTFKPAFPDLLPSRVK